MNVIRGDVTEVYRIYLRRDLHVAPHAGLGHDVGNFIGDFKHAAAVFDPDFFQRRRDRQTYGGARPFRIGDDEVRFERVEAACDAFHGRVETLQVYADIDVCAFGLLSHDAS